MWRFSSFEIQHRCFLRNLPKFLIAGLKDKGKFAYEGKLTFQTIATELHKQPPKAKKRAYKTSGSHYWSRCGCQNWWWKFMSLVLSKLIVTFHLSSVVPKKVELLKKPKVMQLLWKYLDKRKSYITL